MKRPPIGTRVLVRRCGHPGMERFLGGLPGVIYRPRRNDNGAWVRLDTRSDTPGAHPFPEGDDRARDVLAYPADYEVLP